MRKIVFNLCKMNLWTIRVFPGVWVRRSTRDVNPYLWHCKLVQSGICILACEVFLDSGFAFDYKVDEDLVSEECSFHQATTKFPPDGCHLFRPRVSLWRNSPWDQLKDDLIYNIVKALCCRFAIWNNKLSFENWSWIELMILRGKGCISLFLMQERIGSGRRWEKEQNLYPLYIWWNCGRLLR